MGHADRTGTLTPSKQADIIMIRASDLNVAPVGESHTTIVPSVDNHHVDTVSSTGTS